MHQQRQRDRLIAMLAAGVLPRPGSDIEARNRDDERELALLA